MEKGQNKNFKSRILVENDYIFILHPTCIRDNYKVLTVENIVKRKKWPHSTGSLFDPAPKAMQAHNFCAHHKRGSACNTSELEQLLQCTASPANCYSQNSGYKINTKSNRAF